MHHLTIRSLGPITDCDLSIRPYMVLTGAQAAGKSTIAKAVSYFRSLKEDLCRLLLQEELGEQTADNLTAAFESAARSKFLSTFGSSSAMQPDMMLQYTYTERAWLSIRLVDDRNGMALNFVHVEYSEEIRRFLLAPPRGGREAILQALSELLDDQLETVYIPAGRSLLTLLGGQFTYLYSTMDDGQKRLLDACTRDYLERVMKLRPQLADGLQGLTEGLSLTPANRETLAQTLRLIEQILKGRYESAGGEERIRVDGERYVKINFASSGQQESVWILNILYYYLAMGRRISLIIEEPESNLFPASQKKMVELISLFVRCGSEVLLTTHSPYVLGAVNNLLYAGAVGMRAPEATARVLPADRWIDAGSFRAWFVENGHAADCVDPELKQIDSSLLDSISRDINGEYDMLFAIEQDGEGDLCR